MPSTSVNTTMAPMVTSAVERQERHRQPVAPGDLVAPAVPAPRTTAMASRSAGLIGLHEPSTPPALLPGFERFGVL